MTNTLTPQRDTRFSILKALAIMLVVLSHAGISGWLYNFVFLFHVPVFFICAGYFFHTRYLSDERTFVVHRIKGLYLPFVRWSIVLLVLHNLFFWLGILSEHYGNAQGGVTHPFNWSQTCQHLWSIVFNMSGYDPFLGGTFWFFRALLLASIGFLVLFKLLRRSERFQSDVQAGWGLLVTSLALTAWLVGGGLKITGVAQGGYRELMGMSFMAVGFVMRQYQVGERITWRWGVPALVVTGLFAWLCPTSMAFRPTMGQFVALPVPAVGGFIFLLWISSLLNRLNVWISKGLAYMGDRTLYIFAFHLLAFKVASAVKVAWYGLPWESVGSHPFIHTPGNNVLFILLYLLCGVGLPLLWLWAYRRIAPHISFSQEQAFGFAVVVAQTTCRIIYRIARGAVFLFINTCKAVWQGVKDIIAASNPKEE